MSLYEKFPLTYHKDRKEFWLSSADPVERFNSFFKIKINDPFYMSNTINHISKTYGFRFRLNQGMEHGYHFIVENESLCERWLFKFTLWYKQIDPHIVVHTDFENQKVTKITIQAKRFESFRKFFHLPQENGLLCYNQTIRSLYGLIYNVNSIHDYEFFISDETLFLKYFWEYIIWLEEQKSEPTEEKTEMIKEETKQTNTYVWESKRDQIYHENWVELSDAITKAGGNPIFVLEKAESFLDTCARNGIKLNAKHEHD